MATVLNDMEAVQPAERPDESPDDPPDVVAVYANDIFSVPFEAVQPKDEPVEPYEFGERSPDTAERDLFGEESDSPPPSGRAASDSMGDGDAATSGRRGDLDEGESDDCLTGLVLHSYE